MDDLLEFLYKIRKKPIMYFGNRRTLTDLSNFISGFVTGREGTNKEIKKNENWFDSGNDFFQTFIAEKYNVTFSRSWCDIIEFQASSEDEAFELFFKALDEYMEK